MKKSELKQILKPLVKECIKESLMEDGLISGIIAEVVKGMSSSAPLIEVKEPKANPTKERMRRNAFSAEQSHKLKEHKNKLMAAIGSNAYNGVNLFEGTRSLPQQAASTQSGNPMGGEPPDDPGVDISNLFGAVGRKWTAHMDDVKERK